MQPGVVRPPADHAAASRDAVTATARTSAGGGRGEFRPDIQGLRAVAVVAVVSHHLLGWPSGGFLGVDVFFVISGFLITGLLVREIDATGRISWAGFYRRRARRILPAAMVCLVVVVAASFLVYRPARSAAITGDAFWSAVFAANWHFTAVGTDYLGAAGPVSPLQHFWSLAVEEQFYLLWPVMVLALAGRAIPARRLLAAVLVVAVAGSFAWAVWDTVSSPTGAYFSTLTRGWEIATGALLAALVHRLTGLPGPLRTGLAIAGLGLIGAALVVLDATSAVPGPWSAVPVLGAVLVIVAGIGGSPRRGRLLTNRGSQYVGRISFSLYLWHFPVIVLAASLLPDTPWSLLITAATVVIAAVASFHLVEEPLRRPAGRRRPGTRMIAAAMLAVAAVGVTVTVWPPDGAGSATARPTVGGDAQAQLTADIDAALQATVWPELTPAIDGLAETGRPPGDAQCATGLADPDQPAVLVTSTVSYRPVFAAGDAADCAFGDPAAPRLAVVVGDSIAISWIPLVQAALGPRGYRIQGLTMSGCPFVGTATRNPAANIDAYCPNHKTVAAQAIQALQPDIVFVSNTFDPWLRDAPDLAEAAARFADGQRVIIDGLGTSAPVYVLAPPPPGPDPADCATTFSTPSDCVGGIPTGWSTFNAAMATSLHAAPRTTYLDTAGWFCGSNGTCPAFVGGNPTRRDAAGHVVPAYAQRLASLLEISLPG